MAAFGLQHLVAVVAMPQQDGHAEPGAGAEHGYHAFIRNDAFGAAQVQEIIRFEHTGRVRDRSEIVDDRVELDAELWTHERRPDHPRIVGELEQFAADWTGE